MERITANYSGKIHQATLNGRDYIIAPLTLIVPGVLNGSQGPILYTEAETSKDLMRWNFTPLVVNHPVINGNHVSATDPGVLDRFEIGLILNSRWSRYRTLVADGWFDIVKTLRVSPKVYADLFVGRKIELSTGVMSLLFPARQGATFNGKAYTHQAVNLKPDHVAILPYSEGACSVGDGCGVNNA